MQRIGKLYKELYSFSNLLLAHKKAKRGTQTLQSKEFCFYLEPALLELSQQLKNHAYQPDPYKYFTIFEPKERVISVASFRDRIVHHALVNILEPIFEKSFIYHSYATRKNKGTHKAVYQAQNYLRQNTWYLKCDIQKYFDNVNHNILLGQLGQKIKDREMINLIRKILKNAGGQKGLPIGNLTSQFFANVYLNAFDHFVKEKLSQKYYIRYMDDFVVFSEHKTELIGLLGQFKDYLHGLHLLIKPKSTLINSKHHGLPFLGTRIFPGLVRIKRENLKRSTQKIKRNINLLKNGKISSEKYLVCQNSLFAHLSNYNTYMLRKNFIQTTGYLT